MVQQSTVVTKKRIRRDKDVNINQIEDALKSINSAAVLAADKIAIDAANAVKVLAEAATTSTKMLQEKNSGDHDLLIELKTRMEGLKGDIKELSSGVGTRLVTLERDKADIKELLELKKEFENLKIEVHTVREERIRKLEEKVATFMITMGIFITIGGTMIGLIIYHILQK